MVRPKINTDPESVRIQVVFLRTCKGKITGEFDADLTAASQMAKAKFPNLAPLIENLEKKCRQEDAAALAIVLAGELNYGMDNEAAMKDCLENARRIIDDWITVSNLAKSSEKT